MLYNGCIGCVHSGVFCDSTLNNTSLLPGNVCHLLHPLTSMASEPSSDDCV